MPTPHRTETKKSEANQAEGRGFGYGRGKKAVSHSGAIHKVTDDLSAVVNAESSRDSYGGGHLNGGEGAIVEKKAVFRASEAIVINPGDISPVVYVIGHRRERARHLKGGEDTAGVEKAKVPRPPDDLARVVDAKGLAERAEGVKATRRCRGRDLRCYPPPRSVRDC